MSAINREDAINYLMTNMNWHDEDGYTVDDADEKRAIITDLINGIPDADAGWIPVEERLPKESGLYLVTSTDIIDDYAVDTRFFNREKPFVGWSGYEWHEDPLAWMELPKPYIPEEK